MGGSILVIDQDRNFRRTVGQLFSSRSFEVLEASSPWDARKQTGHRNFSITIVDCGHAQVVNWITEIRRSISNAPIVFCSSVPCNADTLNWLNSVLNVALVVQKPIIPEAFIQQVESLLPGGQSKSAGLFGLAGRSQEPEPEPANDIRSQKVQEAINVARVEFSTRLEIEWRELTRLISRRLEDSGAIFRAAQIAHGLRGTAGTLGLMEISDALADIEELLDAVEGEEDNWESVYWPVLMRAHVLADELILRTIYKDRPDATAGKRLLLALVRQERTADAIRDFVRNYEKISIEIASDLTDCTAKLKANFYEGVLIDVDSFSTVLPDIGRCLRSLKGYERLPLGLINVDRLDADMLLYCGISATSGRPISAQTLQECCTNLLNICSQGQSHILIVDDDQVLCRFISKILTDQRFSTSYTTNPAETLDWIEKVRPDLVILDAIMPGLTGYEICRRIRQHERWAGLQVVFLTAKIDAESRAAAYAAGADDFLAKPILALELSSRVHAQLTLGSNKDSLKSRDSDTGLLQADAFIPLATAMIEQARKTYRTMSIALVVVHGIDELTLEHGPDAARLVSKALGRLILQRFKSEDLRVRWSAAVFALAIHDGNHATVSGALNLLKIEFGRLEFEGYNKPFKASVSFGVADSRETGDDIASMVRSAHSRLPQHRRG